MKNVKVNVEIEDSRRDIARVRINKIKDFHRFSAFSSETKVFKNQEIQIIKIDTITPGIMIIDEEIIIKEFVSEVKKILPNISKPVFVEIKGIGVNWASGILVELLNRLPYLGNFWMAINCEFSWKGVIVLSRSHNFELGDIIII